MDTNGGRLKRLQGVLKKELGGRIVKARERRGWSQAELARRLGVTRELLGKWERGGTTPRVEGLALLSEVLEVPFAELGLGWVAEEPISAAELMELARCSIATARLLKPWMERLRAMSGAAPGRRK